jgi:rhodanese-related sulfurtransferase
MDGEILPAELERTLEEEDPLVVDIRHPREFAHERIAGSVNIPLSQLPAEIERVAGADHVVTVCPHGQASVRAARLVGAFEEFDGRVESLAYGLEGWKGPVESNVPETDAQSEADSDSGTDAQSAADADSGTDAQSAADSDPPEAPF